jgi:DinB superfamily
MDPNRKLWNEQQKELQQALVRMIDPQKAIDLFMRHHAMVHSARMAGTGLWSFEDEILDGLDEVAFRFIPPKEDHSIAWILWHLSRIEDVTMNMLVAGSSQVFSTGNWPSRLGTVFGDTGNALNKADIKLLSDSINITELLGYRIAVGRRTREIVKNLQPDEFTQQVDPKRLEKVQLEGAIQESTLWLTDYWGKKTIAGLLLMPPTRHNFVHLNEAARIKRKLQQLS